MKLSMKYFFILLFAWLYCQGAVIAQKTVINGFAPGAERKVIDITAPGDLISMWEKPIASIRIDSTGHFSLSLNLDKTTYAIISIDFHKAEIFLEPSKTYVIQIAPYEVR